MALLLLTRLCCPLYHFPRLSRIEHCFCAASSYSFSRLPCAVHRDMVFELRFISHSKPVTRGDDGRAAVARVLERRMYVAGWLLKNTEGQRENERDRKAEGK